VEQGLKAVVGPDGRTYTQLDFGDGNSITFEYGTVADIRSRLVVEFGTGAGVVTANDAYSFVKNIDTRVTSLGGLLLNDSAADGGLAIARTGTFATSQGAAVTIFADGSFVYDGIEDFVGTDTFTYLARDADGSVAQGTATINVYTPVDPFFL